MISIDQEEKRKLFKERWPEVLKKFDRIKFNNRRHYKAKIGWARRRLWYKIIRELTIKHD